MNAPPTDDLPDRRTALLGMAAAASVPLLAGTGFAADNAEYVPKAGEFPPPGAGVYLAGELVEIDHVNRRGAIRLVGDNDDSRYHSAPSHRFAMLPFGWLRYHGAPAELRDIPIGTVLHGTFLLPPSGDTTIPPSKDKYVPRHSHALALEDDFSFYRRQGRAWKPASVSLTYYMQGKKDWRALPIHAGTLTATPTGTGTNGLTGEQKFTVDRSTRLWRGNGLVEWEDLGPDAVVHEGQHPHAAPRPRGHAVEPDLGTRLEERPVPRRRPVARRGRPEAGNRAAAAGPHPARAAPLARRVDRPRRAPGRG